MDDQADVWKFWQMKYSHSTRILEFRQPARTSRQLMHHHTVHYLLIHDPSRGITGIGECAPLVGLSPDDPALLNEAIEHWCSGSVDNPTDYAHLPSFRFGAETALADLVGGGSRILFHTEFSSGKSAIPINGLVWMGTRETMLREAIDKASAGYSCIKFKVGGIDFAEELQMLRQFRESFPAELVEIRLDANGAFLPDDALDQLEELSQFGIHSIEQPVRSNFHDELRELSRISPIPVALDESLIGILSFEERRSLLEEIQPAWIVLKPTLLGGWTACSEWIQLATECKIGWWITSALESSVGLNAIAQWTATLGVNMAQGLGTGSLYLNNISSPLQTESGFLRYNTAVSWNCDVMEANL